MIPDLPSVYGSAGAATQLAGNTAAILARSAGGVLAQRIENGRLNLADARSSCSEN